MMEIAIVGFIFALLGCLVGGVIIGYFVSRKLFKTAMEKNPPITRDMIKAMYRSMGKTPSESAVNKTMNAISQAQKKQK